MYIGPWQEFKLARYREQALNEFREEWKKQLVSQLGAGGASAVGAAASNGDPMRALVASLHAGGTCSSSSSFARQRCGGRPRGSAHSCGASVHSGDGDDYDDDSSSISSSITSARSSDPVMRVEVHPPQPRACKRSVQKCARGTGSRGLTRPAAARHRAATAESSSSQPQLTSRSDSGGVRKLGSVRCSSAGVTRGGGGGSGGGSGDAGGRRRHARSKALAKRRRARSHADLRASGVAAAAAVSGAVAAPALASAYVSSVPANAGADGTDAQRLAAMLRVCRRADGAAMQPAQRKSGSSRDLSGMARVQRMKEVYQRGVAMSSDAVVSHVVPLAASSCAEDVGTAAAPAGGSSSTSSTNAEQPQQERHSAQKQAALAHNLVQMEAQQPLQVSCKTVSGEGDALADTLASIDDDDVDELLQWTQGLGDDI